MGRTESHPSSSGKSSTSLRVCRWQGRQQPDQPISGSSRLRWKHRIVRNSGLLLLHHLSLPATQVI